MPRDRLVVVSMHIPLITADGSVEPASLTADHAALLGLLSGRPNTLSLAGHMHTTEHHYLGAAHGFSGPGTHHHHVLTAACGSWWSGPFDSASQPVAMSTDGTPKGFHVLEIDGQAYKTRYVPVGHTGHPQLRLTLDGCEFANDASASQRVRRSGSLTVDECCNTDLTVNVFDDGPRTTVTGSIARAGASQATNLTLERKAAADVTAASTFLRHRDVVKPWVTATACTHLWCAALPQLPVGTYVATVQVVDQYGAMHTSSLVFEISA